MSGAGSPNSETQHIPVLLGPLLGAVAPISGVWVDGTFGAGGYTRGLLDAGADRVIGIDRDPDVFSLAESWSSAFGARLSLVEGTFSTLDRHATEPVDGVVLDLGVSSMQLDQPDRGFSFAKDGPLDMRMSQSGESAADLVNTADETLLADILFHFGEERAARRIAREIVRVRRDATIATTGQLSQIIARCLPPRRPGQSHPATRSFQAIRIAVNEEFDELVDGLEAAERAIKPGGWLAVVSFHSLEDRIVKRFFQSGRGGGGNRHAPDQPEVLARWIARNKGIAADAEECARNPRARSATLRTGRRTEAQPRRLDAQALGVPKVIRKGS